MRLKKIEAVPTFNVGVVVLAMNVAWFCLAIYTIYQRDRRLGLLQRNVELLTALALESKEEPADAAN
jgi:hypothetical protein